MVLQFRRSRGGTVGVLKARNLDAGQMFGAGRRATLGRLYRLYNCESCDLSYPVKEGAKVRFGANRRWKGPGFSVTVVVCLLLLALISMVQVGHMHPTASAADRCALCLVMHSLAPVGVAAAAIVLVQLGLPAMRVETLSPARPWESQLFTRPPPQSL